MNTKVALLVVGLMASCSSSSETCKRGTADQGILCFDRSSLGFGLEFNSGTWVGTSAFDTIMLWNGGLTDITVASKFVPDGVFTIRTEPNVALGSTFNLAPGQRMFVEVKFTPTEPKLYRHEMQFGNVFSLQGCGVDPTNLQSECWNSNADR